MNTLDVRVPTADQRIGESVSRGQVLAPTSGRRRRTSQDQYPNGLWLALAVVAYGMWGAAVLYWPLLSPANVAEIFAHRILWAFVALVAVVSARGTWPRVISLVRDRRERRLLAATSFCLAGNWIVYIYASLTGQVLQAALGYFMAPMLAVALGIGVLRERMRAARWAAVALGVAAMAVLLMGHGTVPPIAVIAAVTFIGFLFFKKRTRSAGPALAVEALAVETSVVIIPAVAYVVASQALGTGQFGRVDAGHTLLMIGAGVLSVVALLLLGAALSHGTLTSMGFVGYVEPTVQFLIGLFILNEVMSGPKWAAFALVWTAIMILLTDSYAEHRLARRRASSLIKSAAGFVAAPGPPRQPVAEPSTMILKVVAGFDEQPAGFRAARSGGGQGVATMTRNVPEEDAAPGRSGRFSPRQSTAMTGAKTARSGTSVPSSDARIAS